MWYQSNGGYFDFGTSIILGRFDIAGRLRGKPKIITRHHLMTRKWKCSPRYTTFFMTLKMRVIYCTIFLGQDTIFMTIIFACHRGSVCHKFGVIKGPFSSSDLCHLQVACLKLHKDCLTTYLTCTCLYTK